MSLYPHLREGTVVVDGVAVRYYDSGERDGGVPVILLHGTGGSAENNFWAIFPMLAFTRRVIAFDFALPEGDLELEIEHYVAQAQAVIHAVSPGRPVALVGYSLGAVVAAATAARAPEDIATLVLIAGWMRTDRHQLLRNTVWQHLHDENSQALADFTVYASYSPMHLLSRTPRDYEEILAKSRQRAYSPRVMRLNRTIDLTADVVRIGAPTLVIGCTHDQMVPLKHSRELFGAIENSRYAEIPSGHAVVHERPAELFVLIDTFLADPIASAPGAILASEPA